MRPCLLRNPPPLFHLALLFSFLLTEPLAKPLLAQFHKLVLRDSERPCWCERLRVSHEENENCLTLKKSIRIKDLANGFGHDPMVTAFSRDWNLEW
jgi:hypothetical protein